MRYFRYRKTNVTEKAALKAQYAELTKEEKKTVRKEKALNKIATIVFFAVSFLCSIGCVFAIKQIPAPEQLFLTILYEVGTGILILIAIVASFVIGGFAAAPILDRVQSDRRIKKQQILAQACGHLREYYELQEPCIVTKCYDSSNKSFINRDVCIFVVGDELRITVDLKHGFFHGEKDLGCYAFKLNEITLSKQQGDHFLIAELKTDSTVFLLGYRAKGFIEKNFISRNSAFKK